MESEARFGFFSGKGSVEALRHSGYKNISSAMCEIIDNSIEAGATSVKVILTTRKEKKVRSITRIEKVAIIDNGCGMDAVLLRNSLRIGEGTHKENSNRPRQLGRFGVGLPQSSISQSTRVDVWSWKNGPSSAKRAYIDLDDDVWLSNACINPPDDKPIPSPYIQFINNSTSGTIVEWSALEESSKASTLYNDAENQIGRIYRYWLHNAGISIDMISIDRNGKIDDDNTYHFRPVDPLFLMPDGKITDQKNYVPDVSLPLFEKYSSTPETILNFHDESGNDATVTIRASIAKIREVWPGSGDEYPGNKPYGKFAAENTGISVLREGREIEFYNKTWDYPEKRNPTSRWWGIEIEFTRALDNYFGVINNKQGATALADIAKDSNEDLKNKYGISGYNESQFNELKEEYYPTYVIVKTVMEVNRIITAMMGSIKLNPYKEAKSEKGDNSGNDVEIADAGVEDTLGKGRSDSNSGEAYLEEIKENGEINLEGSEAIVVAIERGHKFCWSPTPLNYCTLFDCQPCGSVLKVMPNIDHRIYDHIFGRIEELQTKLTDEECKTDLTEISDNIKLIVECWCRIEDESMTKEERINLQKMRNELGRKLDEWLEKYEKKCN